MKTLFALLISLVSVSSFAAEMLPALSDVKVVVPKRDGFATVQPTASLEFKYASCLERAFEASTEVESNVVGSTLYVKVVDTKAVDCFGPAIERSYSVQVSTNFGFNQQVVVMNPVPVFRK